MGKLLEVVKQKNDMLKNKLIEANPKPQAQPAQPKVPNVQKAQEGPAKEIPEEQQILQ